MMNANPYDCGSVIPRFHGEEHRTQMAYVVVIEGAEEKDLPEPIDNMVNIYLIRTGEALDANNASDFVLNFRKEAFARYELRKLTEPNKEKGCDPSDKPHP